MRVRGAPSRSSMEAARQAPRVMKRKGVSNIVRTSVLKQSPKVNSKTDKVVPRRATNIVSNRRREAGSLGRARYIARVREMAAQEAIANAKEAEAKKHATEAARTAQEESDFAVKELDRFVTSKADAEQEVSALSQKAIATEHEAQMAAEQAKVLRAELEALAERTSAAETEAANLRATADAATEAYLQARDGAREAAALAKAAFRDALSKKAAAVGAAQELKDEILG